MTALARNFSLLTEALAGLARPRDPQVCNTRYRTPFPPLHLVLFDGDYYQCTAEVLASLRAGLTPAELGLEPVCEGEDD